MSLKDLKNLSPAFDNDKITPFNTVPLVDVTDFTPTTTNDEIVKPDIPTTNFSFLSNAPDLTPITNNDEIVKQDIPTNENSFIANAIDFTPLTDNDVLYHTFTPSIAWSPLERAADWSPIYGNDDWENNASGILLGGLDRMTGTDSWTLGTLQSFPGGFTRRMKSLTDSQLADVKNITDSTNDTYVSPDNMISKMGSNAIGGTMDQHLFSDRWSNAPFNASSNFPAGFNTMTHYSESKLAPYDGITNTYTEITPVNMTSSMGYSIGSRNDMHQYTDFWTRGTFSNSTDFPAGYSEMTHISHSKLAPYDLATNSYNMIPPLHMITEFGNYGTGSVIDFFQNNSTNTYGTSLNRDSIKASPADGSFMISMTGISQSILAPVNETDVHIGYEPMNTMGLVGESNYLFATGQLSTVSQNVWYRNGARMGHTLSAWNTRPGYPYNGAWHAQSWEDLYNSDHTVRTDVTGIHTYGTNVNRENINIRHGEHSWRDAFLGFGKGEPYIISKIPLGISADFNSLSAATDGKWYDDMQTLAGSLHNLDGRILNFGGRSISVVRAVVDAIRVGKYMSSLDGLAHIAKQNFLGLMSRVETRVDTTNFAVQTAMKVAGIGKQTEIIVRKNQNYAWGYTGIAQLMAGISRMTGTTPLYPFRKDWPFGKKDYKTGALEGIIKDLTDKEILLGDDNSLEPTFRGNLQYLATKEISGIAVKYRDKGPLGHKKTGDRMTLASLVKQIPHIPSATNPVIDTYAEWANLFPKDDFESEKNGMPFYFKDLRDNTYVVFRAFLEGLSENISPSWASENYIGRSEPVYIYERATREISFTLKLFAQTPDELDSIYIKLNRLSSLAYPEYKKDTLLSNKTRMKPPLTKFRLGELYGNSSRELTGFIRSLTYSYPDNSPWETKRGKRVPKHITVTITYQVIHDETPSLAFATSITGTGDIQKEFFYGLLKAAPAKGAATAYAAAEEQKNAPPQPPKPKPDVDEEDWDESYPDLPEDDNF